MDNFTLLSDSDHDVNVDQKLQAESAFQNDLLVTYVIID